MRISGIVCPATMAGALERSAYSLPSFPFLCEAGAPPLSPADFVSLRADGASFLAFSFAAAPIARDSRRNATIGDRSLAPRPGQLAARCSSTLAIPAAFLTQLHGAVSSYRIEVTNWSIGFSSGDRNKEKED